MFNPSLLKNIGSLIIYYSLYLLMMCLPCTSQTYNFKSYSVKEGLNQSQVYSICEDRRGNLWFGTYGGGVSKYDGEKFIHFTVKEGLNNNIVYSILEDREGNIWFGTGGGGDLAGSLHGAAR